MTTTTNKTLHGVNLELLSKAMRSVVIALTDAHTSDCLIYAHVGAAVLAELGEPEAHAVAGSAVWRVGSGDADVIAHAIELNGPLYAVDLDSPALPFHAWIALPGHVLDFTTWTLRDKAAALDKIDGGSTSVDWAPDFLLATNESVQSIDATRLAADHGAFAYIRHPEIERMIQRKTPEKSAVAHAAHGVLVSYQRLLAGLETQVFGVGAQGELQTTPPQHDLRRIL